MVAYIVVAKEPVSLAGRGYTPMKRTALSALAIWLITLTAADATTYVTVRDGEFATGSRIIHPYWASFYPYWPQGGKIHRGEAWTDPEFTGYIDQIIALAKSAGLNTLRATDFLDGATSDWRNPTVWANMDYFVRTAGNNHMYVIISIDAYRKWLIHNNIGPYDPAQWTEYLKFFGKRYGDARNILYVPVAGELPAVNGHDPWRGTADQYVAFYTQVLKLLAQVDPHHLHTVGGLSFLDDPHYGIPWQALFSLQGNDFACMHEYSDKDLHISLPMLSAWSQSKHMPLVLEEFGGKQSLGDGARAAYFSTVFAEAKSHGVAGIGFWNLGLENAPSSYEVGPQTPQTLAVVKAYSPSAGSKT